MESLKQVLMRRDQLSESEANERIEEASEVLMEHLDEGDIDLALETCAEMFGLEPDYVMELLP